MQASRRAKVIVASSAIAYVPLYIAAARAAGAQVGALTAGLILLAGWLLGSRAGFAVGAAAPVVATIIEHAVLDSTLQRDAYLLVAGIVFGPLIGGAVGRLREVRQGDRLQIEQLRTAQAALAEAEARWRAVVEHAPCVISTSDLQGRITFVSRTLSNVGPEQLVGRNTLEFIAPGARAEMAEQFRKVIEHGETIEQRVNAVRADGQPAVFLTRQAPIYREGAIIGSVHITQDVTLEAQLTQLRSRLMEQLIQAREDERRWLARELHDGIGQSLSSLLMGLRQLTDLAVEPPAKDKVDELRGLTRTALEDLGRVARGLHPAVLSDMGLQAALELQVQDVRRLHGLQVDLQLIMRSPARLSHSLELAVYRIVQEGLHNVVRHAGANCVSVVLDWGAEAVKVIIEDDGRGCELDSQLGLPRNVGMGLLGIRERATMLRGTATMESEAGVGTTLYVRLPVDAVPTGELAT